MSWKPTLGTWPEAGRVWARVWAPKAERVECVPEGSASAIALGRLDDGMFGGFVPGLKVGDRYRYRIDGRGPFPDPASRFQPEGVHGPSEVVDPSAFAWTDADWENVPAENLVIYELHVGTFTPEGTFAAAAERLAEVADLGATAVELMPVADFPGRWGWGYDGVDLFAPARCYGRPDDLRALVDRAHGLGLAVLLDVVYNHLGPDGNYLAQFSPSYFTDRHETPWGPAVNLDGEGSAFVRDFFVENALHWVREYHIDGFRLDATHYLFDDGPRPFLAEWSARVRGGAGRPLHLIAEDPRNLALMMKPEAEGGYGLDGVWSDDFHHDLRRYLVGDDEGLFRDFRGSTEDLAAALNRGWIVCGAPSIHRGIFRGTDPAGLEPRRFVFAIQNHDRIGNRAWGERLHHQVDAATYRATTALLLGAAATPLLFMGQEWAASAPFLFFCDHKAELAPLIREGRRHEFRHDRAFADPEALTTLPDPQAEATFAACKLDWSERDAGEHAAILRLYRALLGLRRSEPALRSNRCGACAAAAPDAESVVVRRSAAGDGPDLAVVVRLRGAGRVDSQEVAGWEVVLTTEDEAFAVDPRPIEVAGGLVTFERPGAVVLRGRA